LLRNCVTRDVESLNRNRNLYKEPR